MTLDEALSASAIGMARNATGTVTVLVARYHTDGDEVFAQDDRGAWSHAPISYPATLRMDFTAWQPLDNLPDGLEW